MSKNMAKVPHTLDGLSVHGLNIKQRSFETGKKNYIRGSVGGTIPVYIELDDDSSVPDQVMLYIEEMSGSRFQRSTAVLKKKNRKYSGSIILKNTAVYRFKSIGRFGSRWSVDNVPFSYIISDPKGIQDLAIYTLLPTASGEFSQWLSLLPVINKMGFNCIQVLPLTAPDSSASPYAADDHFSFDPALLDGKRTGAEQQFRVFIKALKKHEMSLCIDLVFNHAGTASKMVSEHRSWFREDIAEEDGIKRAGWDDGVNWHKWTNLALFDYEPFSPIEKKGLWNHMTRYALYWAGFAAETGGAVRLDNVHSTYRPFLLHVLSRLRDAYPNLIIFAEHFGGEKEIRSACLDYGINLLLATPWEHKFVPQIIGHLRYLHTQVSNIRYVYPVCSHDSGMPAEEFGDVRTTIVRFALSAFLSPGPIGMVQGMEFGQLKRYDFTDPDHTLPSAGKEDFRALIRNIMKLRQKYNCFSAAGNINFLGLYQDAIIAAERTDKKTNLPLFLILINFDIHAPRHVHIRNDQTGITEPFSNIPELGNAVIETGNDGFTFRLDPFSFAVYAYE